MAERLPLTADFQSWLLRCICDDRGFASVALPHLQPVFFESPIEAWAFGVVQVYHARYGMPPPLGVVIQEAHRIEEPAARENTLAHLVTLAGHPPLLPDVSRWLQDQTLDFARRQHFRQTISQAVEMFDGQRRETEAQDYAIKRMAELGRIRATSSDRAWFFEELEGRQMQRSRDDNSDRISTGLPTLDKILEGGLGKGEFGCWMGHSKRGKTTLLANMGTAATRALRRVLHCVYEGKRQQIENRYDARFSRHPYSKIKKGDVPPEVLERMRYEYERLRQCLVIRGYTMVEDNVWNCSPQTIMDELEHLREVKNWVPDVIIVDYADLLQAREPQNKSATERTLSVYQDLKAIANQGYATWTATQPQRPSEDAHSKPDVLRGMQAADCYGKVKTVDFFGSINMTDMEKEAGVARIYAEMYRDAPADHMFQIRSDLSTMALYEESGIVSPHDAAVGGEGAKSLGYVGKPQQTVGF